VPVLRAILAKRVLEKKQGPDIVEVARLSPEAAEVMKASGWKRLTAALLRAMLRSGDLEEYPSGRLVQLSGDAEKRLMRL